jgi:hypothetical protein
LFTYYIKDETGLNSVPQTVTLNVNQVNGVTNQPNGWALHMTPNPSEGRFKFYGSTPQNSGSIKVVNTLGVVMWAEPLTPGSLTQSVFDLSYLPAATYLIDVTIGEQSHSFQWIKI